MVSQQSKGSFKTLNLKILYLVKMCPNFVSSLLIKLSYSKKVFLFALNFLPWDFLLIKKLEIEKTKTT